MWKRALVGAVGALRRPFSSGGGGISSAVNSMILRSLKDHYLEVAKMNMPPKVSPPSPFTIVKGALDSHERILDFPLRFVRGCFGDSLRLHAPQGSRIWIPPHPLPIHRSCFCVSTLFSPNFLYHVYVCQFLFV
uniref:Uncharacterized protein n=1 Tax=Cajanus cajan TaxID=3821 RepID=A0A151U2B7_CAJCA|nr:hypothetical protein KK1_006041 [Cajanus cajan]